MDVTLTEPLITEWLKHIQEKNKEQEKIIRTGRKFFIPFMAISMPVVRTIFVITDLFSLGPRTKYLALYIYEKFINNRFWEIYKEFEARQESKEYKDACDRLSKLSMLRLMSCIQLASKMDSHIMGLGISQVISALERLDRNHEYKKCAIVNSEIRVFKMIDYKIPLVTPLDCIEVLLAALELDKMPKLYMGTLHVLDITYLQHHQLFAHLQVTAHKTILRSKQDKINLMAMESDIVFLSSAVILCTLEIFNINPLIRSDTAARLEGLIRVEKSDIETFGRIIFAIINPGNVSIT